MRVTAWARRQIRSGSLVAVVACPAGQSPAGLHLHQHGLCSARTFSTRRSWLDSFIQRRAGGTGTTTGGRTLGCSGHRTRPSLTPRSAPQCNDPKTRRTRPDLRSRRYLPEPPPQNAAAGTPQWSNTTGTASITTPPSGPSPTNRRGKASSGRGILDVWVEHLRREEASWLPSTPIPNRTAPAISLTLLDR